MIGHDAWAEADPTACDLCSRDSCEGHGLPTEDAPPANGTAPAPRLAFAPADAVIAATPPVAVVEGIAWAGQITVAVAESGAGKTFLALSVGAAVSGGRPWFGRRTERGSVAYFSYEGDALSLRLRAIRDVQGHRLDHVYVVRASAPLSPRLGRDASEEPSRGELDATEALAALRDTLAAAGDPPVRLVVIDTVRASLAGSEDASDAVAAYLRVVRRLLAVVPDAAALLTHHAGWQDGETKRKRERGSSAWRGNVDATIYIEAGQPDAALDAPITLRTLKVRDGAEPAPLSLVRRVVTLPGLCDAHGRPLTSCVIEADGRTPDAREAARLAASEAATAVFDRQVLALVADRPDIATSAERLRIALRCRKQLVTDALRRLAGRDWLTPGLRGEPFRLTDAGRAAL